MLEHDEPRGRDAVRDQLRVRHAATAGSSAPAITSVARGSRRGGRGSPTLAQRPRSQRRSRRAGSDEHRAVGGDELARRAGVNQRETTASAIASMPSARTSSARSCQPVGSPKRAERAREHEAVDPLRRVRREPHARSRPRARAPQKDARSIPSSSSSPSASRPSSSTRVRAGRDVGAAVPARVVAEHAERSASTRRRCCVPELERRAERVGEDEDRCAVGPVEPMAKLQRTAP